MRPSERVLDLAARDDLGLAPHYLAIWSAVVGLEAEVVLEFGAGGSTVVVLEALAALGGEAPTRRRLLSCSTESQAEIARRYGPMPPDVLWEHRQCLSEALDLPPGGSFDFVLHDGSHAADVVEADLRLALPRLWRFGLAFVHDTQHSYVGNEMRSALRALLSTPPCTLSSTTLPYGFGLTILRREDGDNPFTPQRRKRGSSHRTVPETLRCP